MLLRTDLVVEAARRLFGVAYMDIALPLVFKYDGATTEKAISFNASGGLEGIPYLFDAGPDFGSYVKEHLDKLLPKGGPRGLPIRPSADPKAGIFYRPLVEKNENLLQAGHAHRSIVWTRLTQGDFKSRGGVDPLKDIFEFSQLALGKGATLRFRPGYVENVALYCAVEEGKRLSIPWEPFVLWCSRNEDLPEGATWGHIEDLVRGKLHLTPGELELWFTKDPARRRVALVPSRDWRDHFQSLLFQEKPINLHEEMNVEGETVEERRDVLRRAAAIAGASAESSAEDIARRLVAEGHLNLIFLGPPRTSKTFFAKALARHYLGRPTDADLEADRDHFLQLQLHREVGYQDLIQRQSVQWSDNRLVTTHQPGALLSFLQKPEVQAGKSVIILEEANRANLSAALGELFQVIEMGYRGRPVTLSTSDPSRPIAVTVPKELLLICTMNNVDRSTFPVDMALLGRFRVVVCPASAVEGRRIMEAAGAPEGLCRQVLTAVDEMRRTTGYEIGHAYLVGVRSAADFHLLYQTALRPALQHYLGTAATDLLAQCDAAAESVK